MLGMSAAQLCRLEKARNMPTFQTLRRLAEALDIDILDLTRPPDDAPTACKDERYGDYVDPADIDLILTTGIPPAATARRFGKPPAAIGSVPSRFGFAHEIGEETASPFGMQEDGLPVPVSETSFFNKSLPLERLKAEVLKYRVAEKLAGAPGKTTLHLHFPAEAESNDPEALAKAVRAAGGIGSAPLPDIVPFLEDKGIRVVETELPHGDDAEIFWDEKDRNAWLFLNRDAPDERRRFSAAAELGNLLMFIASGCECVRRTPLAKRFAKDFAYAFLIPGDALREISYQFGRKRDNWTLGLVHRVRSRFGVSAETLIYRLSLLGIISHGLKSSLLKAGKEGPGADGDDGRPRSNRKASRPSRYDGLAELAGKRD